MAIPSDFYTSFRCKTSLMAAGTGLILGYFTTVFIPPFLSPLYRLATTITGVIVAIVVNQLVVHSYFVGKMRGAFEYVYRETNLEYFIASAIAAVQPFGAVADLELESLALHKALMSRVQTLPADQQFTYYMAAAKVANIGGDDRSAIEALKLAVSLKPEDSVANFKLARSFERIGSAQEAIEAYESALHDPSIDTEELKGFIAAQALRVREKGPDQRSPIPGLIYQLM